MARLQSEAKGGFYITPPEEMEHILKVLNVNNASKLNGITLIDPCAGEGDVLNQMASYFSPSIPVTTYGIELEKGRAKMAENQLDHVIAAGYEEVRMSHEAFSLMYLNPPFANAGNQRLEELFLDDLTSDYLPADGLLIFNIPQYVLRNVSKILASRFVDIRVLRFSDENKNYDRFRQVIVFARRRKKGLRSDQERLYQERMEKELYNYSFLGKDALTPLDQIEKLGFQYDITTAPKTVQLFKSLKVEPEDIIRSSQTINHFGKVMQKMSSLEITSTTKNIRPALPLKTTHIAAAISAGALPETMGSHLLVGITKREQEERKGLHPKTGKEQTITTFRPKSIVRVFSDKGIFNLK
ncbi:DUF6094 domain-containing protein [Psychrobacillus sp. FSL H8-0487]|uniref:DUF6094 domain-containing protein n=1 Tax=Psychrobacillus sp. FSL H8-0487 TaxID=2921391 RepID=UPI0030FA9FD3